MKTHHRLAHLTTILLPLLFSCTIGRGATFTVTTTDDDGSGSLRQAILDANANPGPDTIGFNIPGAGPHSIQPLSALPVVTDPVLIDGYTQPGASPNSNPFGMGDNTVLMIELDGSQLVYIADGGHVWTAGLVIAGGSSTVRGLAINGFGYAGIVLTHLGGNVVAGNFIGTDVIGSSARGNGWYALWDGFGAGIAINPWSDGNPGTNVIGGASPAARNLISGNTHGIEISNSDGNQVLGNFIGTDASGTKAVANAAWGGIVMWGGNDNHIGAPGAGNLISGNTKSDRQGLWDGGNGIVAWTTGALIIEGNSIGTDVTGKLPLGNQSGVNLQDIGGHIGGTSAGAGNLISGNLFEGISLVGERDVVQGNLIGPDKTGASALGNGYFGLNTIGAGALVGGTVPEARNVISGNGGYGIQIVNDFSHDNVVQGNFIGTDITGTKVLGSQEESVAIFGGTANLVGGATAAARNVICADSIEVDVRGNENRIQGNFIRADATGTLSLGNSRLAVALADTATNNLIGGPAPGEGNLIPGNGSEMAIDINGPQVTGTLIQGNFIGTDLTGRSPLGIPDAVGISVDGSSGNTIGGTSPGAGNRIAFHLWTGVRVRGYPTPDAFGSGNAILGNSISQNTQIGISLSDFFDIIPNDPLDADIGPNNLQNYPTVTSAATTGSHITIGGTLNSTPNTTFRLEFFANLGLDPAGHAEGEAFIGWTQVTTDSGGDAAFAVALASAVAPGRLITATATDPDGNTSEFSIASPPVQALAHGPKQDVLNDMLRLRATVADKEVLDHLDEAIASLADSLAAELWADESHLDSKHGEKVFDREKNAVNKLRDLLKDKRSTLSTATLQDFIGQLVGVDWILAQVAIQDATNAGANPKKLSEARDAFLEGDAKASDGKPMEAIDHYRESWKRATEALVKSDR